jgi:hypothetical protein
MSQISFNQKVELIFSKNHLQITNTKRSEKTSSHSKLVLLL